MAARDELRKYTITLDPELHLKLKIAVAIDDIQISDIIRKALADYVARPRRPLPRSRPRKSAAQLPAE